MKNAVRDHDANGKAIQCYLEYTEGTGKRNYMNEEGGKKIKILANHLGYVSIEPHIEGSWDAAATVTTAAVTIAVVTTAAPPPPTTTIAAEVGITSQRDIDWLASHNTRRQLW